MNWPLHNSFQFLIGKNIVKVSSDFDSGNLESANITASGEVPPMVKQVELQPGLDVISEQTSMKPSSKAFFHFRVAVTEPVRLRFRIGRAKILKHLYEDGYADKYRICIRKKREKEYCRYSEEPRLEQLPSEELQLTFGYSFEEKDEVYFAFSYPYSYTRMVELVRRLGEEYRNDPDIYLQREVLTYSLEGKPVPVLTITSHDCKTSVAEERISNSLFPESIMESRPFKFKKPVVIVTARVHPGETPSSYALEGFLEFLLNRVDVRAALLRKLFSFVVVPMLNPDGVFKGMYRMDGLGQNLNRLYNNAQSHKHPSVLAVRSLFCYYEREAKMHAYFDMHAHSRLTGWFLYGNACQEFVQQVETKLFARLMSINSGQFNEELCNFSTAQMYFKDANELLSKEGCGRVVAYRIAGIVHSYTLELGFHSCERRQLTSEPNTGCKFKDGEYVAFETPKDRLFTQCSFKEAGRALLISLLDIMELNPYSRVGSDKERDLSNLRQTIAKEIYEKEERFKLMDPALLRKMKNINQLTRQNMHADMQTRFRSINRESMMKSIEIVGNDRYQVPMETTSNKDAEELESPTLVPSGQRQEPARDESPPKILLSDQLLKSQLKISRKRARASKASTSLSKEVVVINQPSVKEEQEYRAIKPLKIDFDPFPKFVRRELEAMVRKQANNINFYRVDELIKQRELVNLPLISRTTEVVTTRRKVSQSTRMPFSVELRLRRNFEIKYGIRQSLPEEEST